MAAIIGVVPLKRKADDAISSEVDPNRPDLALPAPTTPTRASYRSPTRSSLARSHPHLIPKEGQSTGKSRGRRLRSEILNNTKANSEQSELPETVPNRRVRSQEHFDPVEDVTRVISQAGGLMTNKDTNTVTTKEQHSTARNRQALMSRQPRLGPAQESLNKIATSSIITPRLVKRRSVKVREDPQTETNEPELPPTPVQLGLHPAPDRPRGLASSSSPHSSRRGNPTSDRSARRKPALTSSPLKPRPAREVIPDTDENESETRLEEALESDVEDVDAEDQKRMEEKQATIQKLREELKQIQSEIDVLDEGFDTTDDKTSLNVDSELITLLKSSTTATQEQSRRNPRKSSDDNKFDDLPYLTLFAPANLQLSHKTSTRKAKGNPRVHHLLTVTAPPPWPPHVFGTILDVAIDPEACTIQKVVVKDILDIKGRRGTAKTNLHRWIDFRLSHALHKTDVATLICGMGMYFNKSIQRGRAFQLLEGKYGNPRSRYKLAATQQAAQESSTAMTEEDALQLLGYLSMSQIEFDMNRVAPATEVSHESPRIMLLWNIKPDWVGNVISTIEISASGINDEAQQNIKVVFSQLLKTKEVVEAFEDVWNLLHSPDSLSKQAQQ